MTSISWQSEGTGPEPGPFQAGSAWWALGTESCGLPGEGKNQVTGCLGLLCRPQAQMRLGRLMGQDGSSGPICLLPIPVLVATGRDQEVISHMVETDRDKGQGWYRQARRPETLPRGQPARVGGCAPAQPVPDPVPWPWTTPTRTLITKPHLGHARAGAVAPSAPQGGASKMCKSPAQAGPLQCRCSAGRGAATPTPHPIPSLAARFSQAWLFWGIPSSFPTGALTASCFSGLFLKGLGSDSW